jgi:hypothetical protein
MAGSGISPLEADIVLEDGFPIAAYLEERRAHERKSRIDNMIEIAEAVQIGVVGSRSKQGARAFDTWRRYMIKSKDTKQERELTVFEKMRAEKNKETVFQRLKNQRRG